MEKKDYRKLVKDERKKLSNNEVDIISKKIFEKLKSIDKFKESSNVLIYASINNEVDTINIIKYLQDNNVKVALPKVLDDGIMKFYYLNKNDVLEHGCMNILEPIEDNSKLVDISKDSVIITPGVAFDFHGNRIGYGGGYYDRYLEKKNIFSIGLAYDFQIFKKLPVEEHDKKVNMIITESKIIESE